MFKFGKKRNAINEISQSMGFLLTKVNSFEDNKIKGFEEYMTTTTLEDLITLFCCIDKKYRDMSLLELFSNNMETWYEAICEAIGEDSKG